MNFLIAVGDNVASGDLMVSVSPSVLFTEAGNGAYTSPTLRVDAVNPVGELSYSWSLKFVGGSGSDAELTSYDTESTKLQTSGYDTTLDIVVYCEVSDSSRTASAGASITIQFGKGGFRK